MISTHTDSLTINHGGVTRVTHGQPTLESAAPAVHESFRVSSGVTRVSYGSDQPVQNVNTSRYQVGQDANTSSVMATLQVVNGRETVELVPGLPGSRTFIRQALADGLVEPLGNGQYRDKGAATAGPEGATEGQPEANPEAAPVDPGKGVFDATEDADWSASIQSLSQSAYDATAASVTVAVLSGSDNLDRAAANLAEQSSMDPALARMYVQKGHAMYERHVAKAAAESGVEDKQAFYSWLRNSKGHALQHAIQSLTQGRDVSPFRTLAHEFNRGNSELALKARGR